MMGPVRQSDGGHLYDVAIVGAGFGGVGMALQLVQAGIDDMVIVDRGDGFGGVWRANCYPGAACDVPSHLYSFSFEQSADWSRKYAPQAEILTYLAGVATKHGLDKFLVPRAEVQAARFDEAANTWDVDVRMADAPRAVRRLRARSLIFACGQLSQPARCEHIPGLHCGAFRGPVIHTAEWDSAQDLSGKHVAVIGSGASAIQVVPQLAKSVGSLTHVCRSPAYVFPKDDQPYSSWWRRALARAGNALLSVSRSKQHAAHELRGAALLSGLPGSLKLAQNAFARHIKKQIPDPVLRRRMTPDYRLGCKRILMSNDYYATLQQPNVTTVRGELVDVKEHSIVVSTPSTARSDAGAPDTAQEQLEVPVDAIVLATGFNTSEFLGRIDVRGRSCHALADDWKGGAVAHLGMTVHGYPNMYVLYGPNTNLAHNSIVHMLEAQQAYVVQCIAEMAARGLRALEVKAEAQAIFDEEMQRRLRASVWATGCSSWYVDAAGRVTHNWPGLVGEYRKRTRHPNIDRDFIAVR
ncbi:unnamed protein product [Pedinophyceae sp. YPF-701]|nr:unnamed protein product [Pedinophyceae sp. YPF-701]